MDIFTALGVITGALIVISITCSSIHGTLKEVLKELKKERGE